MTDNCCALVRLITTTSPAQTVNKISSAMLTLERDHILRTQLSHLSPKQNEQMIKHFTFAPPLVDCMAPAACDRARGNYLFCGTRNTRTCP